jgi:imidazolonepropionase-like amidohydrolase
VLSQTGAHGDTRPANVPLPECGCELVSGRFSQIADGPDAVRKATRHELHEGSDFLKIMASGGVASPSDPFDGIQYTAEEVKAITVEAEHRHTYVTAHAYSPEATRQRLFALPWTMECAVSSTETSLMKPQLNTSFLSA